MSEIEVRTPDRRAAPPCPCCTGFCSPFVREYTDERRAWWVVTPCGTDYRIDDPRLQWQHRNQLSGEWLPDGPPDPTFLDQVLGR